VQSRSRYEYTGLGWNAKAWTAEKEETDDGIPLAGYASLCFMGGMQKEERRVKKLGFLKNVGNDVLTVVEVVDE